MRLKWLVTAALCGAGGAWLTLSPRLGAQEPAQPELGINASLHGKRPFPASSPWNTPINGAPVDPNSDALINSIGRDKPLHPDFGANWNGGPFGIPYIVVRSTTPKVPVSFQYANESDPGPYPIPALSLIHI